MEPRGQTVWMPGQPRRLADHRAKNILADLLGDLTVAGAAQGDVIDQSKIALREFLERGFIVMGGESGEKVAVGILHVLFPI